MNRVSKGLVLMALLTLCLAGCAAGRVWDRPNLTAEEANYDVAQCKYAMTVYGYVPASYYRPGNVGQAIGAGMADGVAQAMREMEIFNACMRARGYQLVTRKTGE